MPRSGVNGTYTLPGPQANATTLQPISSATNNQGWTDVAQTFNTVQPEAYGGTGASTFTQAAINLGVNTKVGRVTRLLFTSSATYTPDAKMLFCLVQAQAAGGGAGGTTATNPGTVNGAGGAGSGGYSEGWFTKAQIGASQAVSIGAAGVGGIGPNPGSTAGAVSLGTLIVALGGFASGAAGPVVRTVGGNGGAAGTGQIALPGQRGNDGSAAGSLAYDATQYGGKGGDSRLGFGGTPTINSSGLPGVGFGGGGSGGSDFNNIAVRNGGNGAPGILIITEFCSE